MPTLLLCADYWRTLAPPRPHVCSPHADAVPQSTVQQVSLSSVVMPMVKMVPRGFTAAADAYLTPHILRCAGAAAMLLLLFSAT